MNLYRTNAGIYLTHADAFFRLDNLPDDSPGNLPGGPSGDLSWDRLFQHPDLAALCDSVIARGNAVPAFAPETILPPVGNQEVWAAGVTYYRSRDARMEESREAGGGDFYDRVYTAERPELFFKATARRVVGHNGDVRIRSDARWSVPEPELTLALHPSGRIIGYTVGNDMSSRDIEGENPLYLPQAKLYDRSCALGPCLSVNTHPLPATTAIRIAVHRGASVAFSGDTSLAELKRDPQLLADYLFRDNSFPDGCFLMTGTGIVPPDSFTLAPGDRINITIDSIGTLTNQVA